MPSSFSPLWTRSGVEDGNGQLPRGRKPETENGHGRWWRQPARRASLGTRSIQPEGTLRRSCFRFQGEQLEISAIIRCQKHDSARPSRVSTDFGVRSLPRTAGDGVSTISVTFRQSGIGWRVEQREICSISGSLLTRLTLNASSLDRLRVRSLRLRAATPNPFCHCSLVRSRNLKLELFSLVRRPDRDLFDLRFDGSL
jgi:hypothetical protein